MKQQVRTYMQFTSKVDPARIFTIPDMDLSYALAATLVEWDSQKQIVAGLASKWDVASEKVYRFTIRSGARWSDGKPVTSSEIKRNFVRAFNAYPEDLRSLINLVDRIECPSDDVLEFHLKMAAQGSGLLGKLTEPNYGVLKLRDESSLDLSVTTGPFRIAEQSENEMVLKRNPNWHRFAAETPEEIVIRRPKDIMDSQRVLLTDPWPNLIETSSLISKDVLSQYEARGFSVWRRPLDKVFHFMLSSRQANRDGFALLRYLGDKKVREQSVSGLDGYELAAQMFPVGYQLHSQHPVCSNTSVVLPEAFKKKPLEILISPARVFAGLRENLRKAITEAVGIEPKFISVPLQDVAKHKKAGDFDLYAGTVGLADPDPEGAMSYYLEGPAPLIPGGPGNDENFVARLDGARREPDRLKRLDQMRGILSDAVCKGHVLPLFHLSTVGIGKPELDFSAVAQTDESVTLSKIRFKEGASK